MLMITYVMMQEHSSVLTTYEQSEVSGFPKIYFYGPKANKIQGMPTPYRLCRLTFQNIQITIMPAPLSHDKQFLIIRNCV